MVWTGRFPGGGPCNWSIAPPGGQRRSEEHTSELQSPTSSASDLKMGGVNWPRLLRIRRWSGLGDFQAADHATGVLPHQAAREYACCDRGHGKIVRVRVVYSLTVPSATAKHSTGSPGL